MTTVNELYRQVAELDTELQGWADKSKVASTVEEANEYGLRLRLGLGKRQKLITTINAENERLAFVDEVKRTGWLKLDGSETDVHYTGPAVNKALFENLKKTDCWVDVNGDDICIDGTLSITALIKAVTDAVESTK